MQENTKKRVLSSFIWRFLERCGAHGVSFIVSVILARLLEPEAYGTIALVLVFTSILNVFVDSGLGNSLIQKKDADDIDFSSVFYFNLFVCLILYFLLFLAAPFISNFYNYKELTPVIRVLGVTVLISGVKNVQQAYVSRHLIFKKFFYSTLAGTIGAAIVGITMAYKGFGVWALVAQQVFNNALDTIILWITVKWRPKKVFSFQRLKGLINFGWKLLASSLLHTLYLNLRSLIIGKLYSSEDLAFYNKGSKFPSTTSELINDSLSNVLFPVMSEAQDNTERVRKITRNSILINSYIICPLMIGLAVVAKSLVTLLLTDKWLGAVPFLRIVCFTYMLDPIQTSNLNAIKALGRSDIYFKIEIIKKVIAFAILIVAMRFGVMAIAWSGLVFTFFDTIFNVLPNKKLINYTLFEQIRDILPFVIISAFMGIAVYLVELISLPCLATLLLQIIIGVLVYTGLSVLFKLEQFTTLLNVVKGLIKK